MSRLFHNLSAARLGLLVLGLLGGLPTLVEAAGIGFRNDLSVRVMIQGASLVNNVLRKGPALVIDPGKTVWDTNVPSGNREVIIYGGQPIRILERTTIPFQGRDMTFSIVMDRTGQVRVVEKKSP
jgi:hypothetical protein